MKPGFDVVTGAFSYTGRFIARRLLDEGRRVRTLTNHPQRPGAQDLDVELAPLTFTDRAALVESLRGADVFYNTYWIRFRHRGLGFGEAVANTRVLMSAAVEAGVTVDAAGPEVITYAELVHNVAIAVRRRPRIVYLLAELTLFAGNMVGLGVRDVLLTRQELEGLMQELLVSHEPPRGALRVDDWLMRSAGSLGKSYASELNRHFR